MKARLSITLLPFSEVLPSLCCAPELLVLQVGAARYETFSTRRSLAWLAEGTLASLLLVSEGGQVQFQVLTAANLAVPQWNIAAETVLHHIVLVLQ